MELLLDLISHLIFRRNNSLQVMERQRRMLQEREEEEKARASYPISRY